MPVDPVVAGLRARAAEYTEIAARMRRAGLPGVEQVEALAAEALEIAADMEALTARTDTRTMVHMEPESRELKIGKSRAGDHPFVEALHAKGITVTDWAEAQKAKPPLTREKVSSWYKPGKGGRRIPRVWALAIQRDFGIPLSAWPHGIKG